MANIQNISSLEDIHATSALPIFSMKQSVVSRIKKIRKRKKRVIKKHVSAIEEQVSTTQTVVEDETIFITISNIAFKFILMAAPRKGRDFSDQYFERGKKFSSFGQDIEKKLHTQSFYSIKDVNKVNEFRELMHRNKLFADTAQWKTLSSIGLKCDLPDENIKPQVPRKVSKLISAFNKIEEQEDQKATKSMYELQTHSLEVFEEYKNKTFSQKGSIFEAKRELDLLEVPNELEKRSDSAVSFYSILTEGSIGKQEMRKISSATFHSIFDYDEEVFYDAIENAEFVPKPKSERKNTMNNPLLNKNGPTVRVFKPKFLANKASKLVPVDQFKTQKVMSNSQFHKYVLDQKQKVALEFYSIQNSDSDSSFYSIDSFKEVVTAKGKKQPTTRNRQNNKNTLPDENNSFEFACTTDTKNVKINIPRQRFTLFKQCKIIKRQKSAFQEQDDIRKKYFSYQNTNANNFRSLKSSKSKRSTKYFVILLLLLLLILVLCLLLWPTIITTSFSQSPYVP